MNAWARLKSAASVLWRGTVAEATVEEVYGRPVAFWDLFGLGNRRPVINVWNADTRKEKNATLRTLQDHDRARNMSRVLAETNPNAIGLLQRLQAYNVGKGSSTEIQAVKEDAEPPKRLAARVRDFVKAFKKVNDWLRREKEMVFRLHVDGEFFLRFFPNRDGTTRVRFIEPACIRPPLGESSEGDWSFGVHTPDMDAENPVEYCLHDFATGTEEIVDAIYMIHAKINCLANQKRGVPSLYAVEEELTGTARLRYAIREGEKNRASINYFRRHKAASADAVRTFRDARTTEIQDRPTSTGNESQIYIEKIEPGSTIDIPEGLDPLPPPGSPNTESGSRSVDMGNEAIAARFGVPVYVVSGRSEGGNFAQALVAESPFTVTLQDSQADLAEISDAAQTKAVEIGAEQGYLPEDVLEQVDLMVSFPSPISRNRLEETNRRKILYEKNILSEETWATEEGLDAAKQKAQIREERADVILPLPTRVTSVPVDPRTGMPYNPPAGGGGVPPANGAAPSGTPAARYQQLTKSEPLREQAIEAVARLLIEGWNEDDHPRGQPENAGEFGPGGGGAKKDSVGGGGSKDHAPSPTSSKPAAAPAAAPKGTPLERMGLIDRIKHALADLGFISRPSIKGPPWAEVSHLSVAQRAESSPPRQAFVGELESDLKRQGQWRSVARDNGMPVEQLRQTVADNLNKMIEPLRVCMRFRSTERLDAVLDSGEFKNQFFPGVTSEAALNDKKMRSSAEEKSMGVPADAPHTARPVYGYLTYPDNQKADVSRRLEAADRYGATIVNFKGHVKDNMTVSYGDSLMGGVSKEFVSNAPGQAHPESIDPQTIAAHGMEVTKDFGHFDQIHRGYIEAHLHNGTRVSDIESVEFSKDSPPSEATQAKLAASGIKWSIY